MNELLEIQYPAEDEPYIKMVYEVAHKYAENARCSFDDYVSVGIMALHKAKETFDPAKGVKFTTHAYGIIDNDIMKEWQNNVNELSCSTYHVKNTEGAKEEVAFQNATIVAMHNRDRDDEQGLEHDISPSGGFTSVNKVAKAVASGSLSPEEGAQTAEIAEKVDAILDSLDDDDKDIIISRMFQGETFDFIASKMNMSWRSVNYRYHKVKESLKDKFVAAGLDVYA